VWTPTLSAYGRRRRVSGLGREEVAFLAIVSVECHTQLERCIAGAFQKRSSKGSLVS
jgi:hypothetical protein